MGVEWNTQVGPSGAFSRCWDAADGPHLKLCLKGHKSLCTV